MKRVLFSFALAAAMLLGAPQARSTVIPMYAVLTGANEFPVNASPGTGLASFVLDTVALTLQGHISFSGLAGTTTAAHIHCCLANPFQVGANVGVATLVPAFPLFPLGVTAGVDDFILDLTLAASYNAGFITAQGSLAAAQTAFINGLTSGRSYLNIHTTAFPGGEIRGFVTVPEPMTSGLVIFGLAAAAFVTRRRQAGPIALA